MMMVQYSVIFSKHVNNVNIYYIGFLEVGNDLDREFAGTPTSPPLFSSSSPHENINSQSNDDLSTHSQNNTPSPRPNSSHIPGSQFATEMTPPCLFSENFIPSMDDLKYQVQLTQMLRNATLDLSDMHPLCFNHSEIQ